MTAYYNEIDPYAAQWLRNLMWEELIATGDVDERSITDVRPGDLKGYSQCHFFAGIGGWSVAMRMAGWEDGRPVWTGSCPCQPFSVAGRGKAQSDERHLWPYWFNLIAEVRPPVVFGEQVAGAIAHGWLDDAFDDLEREGYETAAAVLPACSVGAPHKRDRLWFVADANNEGPQGRNGGKLQKCTGKLVARKGSASMANTAGEGLLPSPHTGVYSGEAGARPRDEQSERQGADVANAMQRSPEQSEPQRIRGRFQKEVGAVGSFSGWQSEPAVGRVANGIQARAHKLRAYGNAIVPQVAAEFISAFMECRP